MVFCISDAIKFLDKDQQPMFSVTYSGACNNEDAHQAVREVIFNPPYTIVNYEDGSKSIVCCHNEEFDYEKGLMAALVKHNMKRADFERIMEKGKQSLKNRTKKLEHVAQ